MLGAGAQNSAPKRAAVGEEGDFWIVPRVRSPRPSGWSWVKVQRCRRAPVRDGNWQFGKID